jgi:hypothetical protein
MNRLPLLRGILILVGTLVWLPYLYFKYVLRDPFPVGPVLAIHIPCMVGALCLRIYAWRNRKN